MAIPTWTWSEQTVAGRGRSNDATASNALQTDVNRISSEFELLSSPVRLEILLALSATDGPLSYTALREATSIEDNGKFNYHLRQLEGLVAGTDGEYVLTGRGRSLVARVRGR